MQLILFISVTIAFNRKIILYVIYKKARNRILIKKNLSLHFYTIKTMTLHHRDNF